MRKLILVLAALLVLPAASAIETPITVNTDSIYKVTITILRTTEEYYSIKSFYELPAAPAGKVYAFYDGPETEFDIAVYLTENGRTAHYKRFGHFKAGEPAVITFTGSNETGEENNSTVPTETNETSIQEENRTLTEDTERIETNRTALSGFAIFGVGGGKKYIVFAIVGLIAAALIVFIVGRRMKSPLLQQREQDTVAIRKESSRELPKSLSKNALKSAVAPTTQDDILAQLRETQKRLDETRRELELLKNKDKIREAEMRLERDRKELERLRGGM